MSAFHVRATRAVCRTLRRGSSGGAALLLAMVLSGAAGAADTPQFNAVGPPLSALNTKLADPNWLVAWLLQPSKLRPGTAMPDFDLTPDEVQAMARYLYSTSAPAKAGSQWQGGDARLGEKLFVSRGCRGCHAIAPGEKSLSVRVPNLAGIGLKVRGDWLFEWIKSPRTYNPSTAMPQLAVSDGDVRHLVAFLLSRKDKADIIAAAPPFTASGDPQPGRAAVERYECAKCHQVSGLPAPAPPFELTAGANAAPDAVLRDGRALVEYYNCRGCHRIEGGGGAIAEHLERKTLAPPTLEGEGARVQHSWLVQFLQRPITLRPWLEMHMPSFGFSDKETRALAGYFAVLANVPATDESRTTGAAEITQLGLRRLAHYKCAQCHPMTPEVPAGADPENLSINLSMAKDRLRPSWIRRFLAGPKAIVGTQTRMPTVFFTIDGVPKVEHPDRDIEAITAYLMQMTEPLDVALAKLDAGRKADAQKQEVDWSTVQY